MQLLLLEEGHCFRDQALEVCGFARLQPAGGAGRLVAVHAGAKMSGGRGIGVTLIPEMAVGGGNARAQPLRCSASRRDGRCGRSA